MKKDWIQWLRPRHPMPETHVQIIRAHAAVPTSIAAPGGGSSLWQLQRPGIVTAGRIPIRPHPKPIRIQNSDGWAFLTSVSAPRFPIQRVTWMGFLDRGQSKVIGFLCSTAVSFRPSSRPRRNPAISLGQHHFYSCGGPLLTVAPVRVPSCPPCSAASAARGRFLLFCDATPTIHSN